MKDISQMEREFDEYERRIQRLKELEKELNSLNTEGLEPEANAIKSKLKDPKKVEEIEKGIATLKVKIKEREEWKKTTPGLFDTAQRLANEATKLFEEKEYEKSLGKYQQSLRKFIDARNGAEKLKDEGLVRAIGIDIYNVTKSIIACENAIGISLSEEAKKSFDVGSYEDAISTYRNAVAKFEDALGDAREIEDSESIERTQGLIKGAEENMENCKVAIDKREVEKLFKESKSLHEKAAELAKGGEMFNAKDVLRDAEAEINSAFKISTKRKFSNATSKLTLLLKTIRDEMNVIDEKIASGITSVDFSRDIAKIKDVGVPEVEMLVGKEIEIKRGYEILKPDIKRETEFFNGFIRLKMAVTNPMSQIITDVSLDLDLDEHTLRLDRHEPESYSVKRGKVQLGTISPGTGKTVSFYLDPMTCTKAGTDINCRVDYKDAYGKSDSTRMESKKVEVVCPIFSTESDINIGMLKEFIENLPYHDSKVYQIPTGFGTNKKIEICRETIQMHDVRHIRTLRTKDDKTCETWYYGKTKVAESNIVIKASINEETESIEIFAATPAPESLTGLLAELGHNLTKKIQEIGEKPAQVVNVSIKDTIIQRSPNLLNLCDMNGVCREENIIVEDSVIQRSSIRV